MSPCEALAGLCELCHQWLQSEVYSKEQMLKLLVLKQFLGVLLPNTWVWVESQCPKSDEEAVTLVEHLAQGLGQNGKPRTWGKAGLGVGAAEGQNLWPCVLSACQLCLGPQCSLGSDIFGAFFSL